MRISPPCLCNHRSRNDPPALFLSLRAPLEGLGLRSHGRVEEEEREREEKATPAHASVGVVVAKAGGARLPVQEWVTAAVEKQASAPPLEAVSPLIAPVEDVQDPPAKLSSRGDDFLDLPSSSFMVVGTKSFAAQGGHAIRSGAIQETDHVEAEMATIEATRRSRIGKYMMSSMGGHVTHVLVWAQVGLGSVRGGEKNVNSKRYKEFK
ncbi:hypothetical protein MUK42_13946 [Musa troglodytarum]|uniref:Uncharacterized protein n=1 Tax=Musa troglodytarum TaxID=320322 RepID=A0A9E7HEW8_9LILI|nr:hypothetical protein MUK42_13946 [Musa troglodytarum]